MAIAGDRRLAGRGCGGSAGLVLTWRQRDKAGLGRFSSGRGGAHDEGSPGGSRMLKATQGTDVDLVAVGGSHC